MLVNGRIGCACECGIVRHRNDLWGQRRPILRCEPPLPLAIPLMPSHSGALLGTCQALLETCQGGASRALPPRVSRLELCCRVCSGLCFGAARETEKQGAIKASGYGRFFSNISKSHLSEVNPVRKRPNIGRILKNVTLKVTQILSVWSAPILLGVIGQLRSSPLIGGGSEVGVGGASIRQFGEVSGGAVAGEIWDHVVTRRCHQGHGSHRGGLQLFRVRKTPLPGNWRPQLVAEGYPCMIAVGLVAAGRAGP